MTVRPARVDDAAAVARIYAEGVEDRVATFRAEPIVPEAFAARIGAGTEPILVAEEDGRAVAWAGWAAYGDPVIYSGVGEYAIYVARDARGRGVGADLLDELCAEAGRRGLYKLLGKLFTDNAASIALAHRCGFRDVGVHIRHGRLDGTWRDVLVVERALGPAVA